MINIVATIHMMEKIYWIRWKVCVFVWEQKIKNFGHIFYRSVEAYEEKKKDKKLLKCILIL